MKDADEREMDGVPGVATPADTGLRVNLFFLKNIFHSFNQMCKYENCLNKKKTKLNKFEYNLQLSYYLKWILDLNKFKPRSISL